MHTLTLNSIPEGVYAELKRAAREHKRTLAEEAVSRLEQTVGRVRRDPKEFLKALDERHKHMRLPYLTDEFLNEAKRMGRP